VVSLAILVGWIVRTGHQTFGVELPDPAIATLVRSLTTDEKADYHRDGTVLARGLLTTDQTNALRASIQSAPSPPGTIFDLFSRRSFDTIRFDLWRTDPTVAGYALLGLPAIAASVFYNDDGADAGKKENDHNRAGAEAAKEDEPPHLRLLRDAYFSYVPGGRGCGWHVDDEAFWPTLNDTSGVTIWIALDDISNGGGLLVANRTKFVNEPDLLPHCRAQSRARTCDMETLAPECHEKLEQTAIRSWGNLKAGDAILWDRWVFHRTVPTTTTTNDAADDGASSRLLPLRRYSVRFIPDNAKAFGAIHTSVEQEGSFVGSPYYPQVWPHLLADEVEALRQGQLDMTDVTLLNLFRNLGRFMYRRAVDALIVHTSSTTSSRSSGGGTIEPNTEKESSS
jgi:hypothetical protein